MPKRLNFGDYLKAAFQWPVHVPVLGPMPLNQLALGASAVLGLANPGFWLLGAALEIAFLFWRSSNPRFQKVVQGNQLLEAKESYDSKVRRALERLTPEAQKRYHALLSQCREIVGISETLDDGTFASLRDVRSGGLNQMLWIFLRLLASRQVVVASVKRVNKGSLEKDIEKIQKRLEGAASVSALRRSLEGTLEIQKKRLENLDKASSSLLVLDAELNRIEQQVVLVREETAVSGKAEMLSSSLDAVSGTLSETNRWMEQNAEIFGSLGADPLGSAPADLPSLPPPLKVEQ